MLPELDFSIDIAKQAGEILLKYYGSNLTRNVKRHENDFATEADVASEKFLISQIQKHFPKDSIVAEESGTHDSSNAEFTWIIDPLDGTYNFANNKKKFGVLIARTNAEGDIIMATAYDPLEKLLGKALKGEGVFLNNKQILFQEERIENVPISANSDMEKTLAIFGSNASHHSAIGAVLDALQGNYWAHVASAGFIWDFAAQALMLQEAGWVTTDLKGNTFKWDGKLAYGYPGVISAPKDWHTRILEKI